MDLQFINVCLYPVPPPKKEIFAYCIQIPNTFSVCSSEDKLLELEIHFLVVFQIKVTFDPCLQTPTPTQEADSTESGRLVVTII